MKIRKQRLRVELVDGRLVISIGIDTLSFAAKYCDRFWNGETGKYELKVINRARFARDVVRQLCHEEEDGTTPVHRLFDAAFEAAVDDGSDGVRLPGDGK